MTKFTDYIFDIVQNAISAKADKVSIIITKIKKLKLIVTDNGHDLNKKQIKEAVSPFYTTRTTRKVGLGLPLIILLSNQTNGSYGIKSSKLFGTKVIFKFDYHHFDFPDEGNYGMLVADIASHPQMKKLAFRYQKEKQYFQWHKHKQTRKQIIQAINENIKDIEVTYEVFS